MSPTMAENIANILQSSVLENDTTNLIKTEISADVNVSRLGSYDGVTKAISFDNISNVGFITTSSSGNTTDMYYDLIKQPVVMLVVLSVSYSIVFFLALFGNLSVVLAVARDRSLHTATNLFLVNMAIADMLVAIFCLPVTLLSNIFNGWQFGAFMCRATPYLQGVAVCASVNTLVVIAVDRYIAICHVMRQRNTKRMAKVILFFIWFLALLLMTPWALYYKLSEYRSNVQVFDVCFENFPEPVHQKAFFLGVIFLMCYAIPLIFIVACYFMIGYRVWNRDAPGITSSRGVIEKSKVRVLKMLVVVVLLFMFSWMPLYIIRLRVLFAEPEPGSDEFVFINEVAIPFAQWLGTSNSCMNPLVYCLFSQKIRGRIKAMLCCSKPEARSLYSSRSVYNSALQPSASIREPTFKVDAFANGYSRQGHFYGAGSVFHQRFSRSESHRSSRSETPRSLRLESEQIRLQCNNNSARSTRV